MNPSPHQPVAPSCLCTPAGERVPLLGVSLTGEVYGADARLVLRQRYRNDEKAAIEAIYTFPIPSEATLVGFAMECAGRRLEAEVKEREEAFHAYDEAIAKGHGAALLEEERRNVFTASVGNLLPGEDTVIEVAFVQRLAAEEGALRLVVPTLVAPRYVPGAPAGDRTGHGRAAPTDRVPDADRVTPAIAAVQYGLAMDLLFDLGRNVTIESPSHRVVTQREEGHRERVRFQSDEVALDRDVVLVASGAPGPQAGVVCDKQPGKDGTFAITVVPDLFDGARRVEARDVVFVVDVSGSMQGESIDQARRALRLCLRHLSEGDRFEVIAFSTGIFPFAQRLVPYTQRTLEDADRFVAALSADGGTEMLGPLCAATALLADPARDRLVVLLTDGQVANEAEIVDRVATEAKGARVYTFGIGTNVSDLLIHDLARRTRGAAELIYPGERIDEKVTAQFAKATAARVEGLEVKLAGLDAGELAPAELPALVDGEPWVLYGRYEQPGAGKLELRGTLRGERFYLAVPIELPGEAARAGLSALWAGARVRDLEEDERKLSGRRAEAQRKRILDLAITYNVASKHASFVVVEKRTGDRRSQGQPETRPVPVSAPAGWGMFGAAGGGGARMMAPQLPAGTAAMAPMPFPASVRARGAFAGSMPARLGAPIPPPASMPLPAAPPPPPGYGPPPRPAPMAAPSPGFVAKLRRAIGWEPRAEAAFEDSACFEDSAFVEGETPHPARTEAVDGRATDAFERQLASGLWEGDRADDAGRLLATARRLRACRAEGIDTAHPVFGAQVAKAVEAVCELATRLLAKGEAAAEVAAALAAAYLVATGPRLRARIKALVDGAAAPALRALAGELGDERALDTRLAAL
jgi:Ca-activated chloride channel family protein